MRLKAISNKKNKTFNLFVSLSTYRTFVELCAHGNLDIKLLFFADFKIIPKWQKNSLGKFFDGSFCDTTVLETILNTGWCTGIFTISSGYIIANLQILKLYIYHFQRIYCCPFFLVEDLRCQYNTM